MGKQYDETMRTKKCREGKSYWGAYWWCTDAWMYPRGSAQTTATNDRSRSKVKSEIPNLSLSLSWEWVPVGTGLGAPRGQHHSECSWGSTRAKNEMSSHGRSFGPRNQRTNLAELNESNGGLGSLTCSLPNRPSAAETIGASYLSVDSKDLQFTVRGCMYRRLKIGTMIDQDQPWSSPYFFTLYSVPGTPYWVFVFRSGLGLWG